MNDVNLGDFARDEYSQCGEDGIIERILEILPDTDDWCVEFGAWDGIHFSNTYNLIKNKGYNAVLIEADSEKFRELKKNLAPYAATLINEFVTFEGRCTLDSLLSGTRIPKNFDFLSIDIDGNDYWILESLVEYKPKVVCIEFNPTIPNEVEYIQPRDFSVKRGSSPCSINRLAREKNYELLATTRTNLIFVDRQYFSFFNIKNNSLDVIRDDSTSRVFTFVGFDGTIIHSAPIDIPCHRFRIGAEELQILPGYLRRFFPDYGAFRKILFLILLLRINPKSAMDRFKFWLGNRLSGSSNDT